MYLLENTGESRVSFFFFFFSNIVFQFMVGIWSNTQYNDNSGDFVRSNGLQEGDFIVIYSDVKCGKYVKHSPHFVSDLDRLSREVIADIIVHGKKR